ncbi:TIGR02452 family protein [Kamptonema cortianum]|uniref:TIGR02452 family protein n=1 Tax=Geitlerinema calcuttense NRMC-F 0142 TaxID=2922238 RepID=A0ABT7LWM7_9CYAN|nr:TIGR02452 family protein [Geitlerinema calcuttense]MDK3159732.1 TIGR02452 family protein [Kamptonema cortianum]MDL5055967.1 TIGR02452 family protein [Geitlerinema calcuttense NRMC-F 0142]
MKRIAIAQDTLNILKAGYYQSSSGERVEITSALRGCLEGTQYYEPEQLSTIQNQVLAEPGEFSKPKFEVKNETTLEGAERLAKLRQFKRIGVLNFASAKNAGGGFLNGAQAQEESLARTSALYPSLLKCPAYYEFHRQARSLLYSDRIIYSPNCPVFRKDDGTLLERPYQVDFITSPAPNAGAIRKSQPQEVPKIPETLYQRGAKVLSLAAYHQCDALVLGAWGCGVFRNDPALVAQMFEDYLLPKGQFWGKFKSILFSVLDTRSNLKIITEFQARFS